MMKPFVCPQEGAVWRAVRATHWDEALRAHVRACSVCGEIVQATRWMQSLSQSAKSNVLPDASLLWRQSRLSEKQAEMKRVLRPLEAIEVLPGAIAALVFGSWLVWTLPSTGGILAWVLTRALPQVWRITWTMATAAPQFFSSGIFMLAVVAVSLGALFVTSPLLARE